VLVKRNGVLPNQRGVGWCGGGGGGGGVAARRRSIPVENV